jgi:hypothetical protein
LRYCPASPSADLAAQLCGTFTGEQIIGVIDITFTAPA